jgi:ankyrin repeat protein
LQNVVNYLLEKGADIETQSFGGLRPLHHACNQSKEAIITRLLEAGANTNARDDNDNTCLHWAAAR